MSSSDEKEPDTDRTSQNRSPLLVAAIPTLVLIAIALIQYTTTHTTVLTPWKGGGFGMFSTVDHDRSRTVTLYLRIDGEEIPVALPDGYGAEIVSLRPMPTEARTEALASRMATENWIWLPDYRPPPLIGLAHVAEPATDGHYVLARPMHDPEEIVDLDGVRLQVWAPQFRVDGQTGGGELRRTKIQDVFAPAPAAD